MDMCKRQNQLLAVYQRTVWSFGVAVDALQAAYAMSTNPVSYKKIRQNAEEALALSEQARINLEKHVQEHGCQEQEAQPHQRRWMPAPRIRREGSKHKLK